MRGHDVEIWQAIQAIGVLVALGVSVFSIVRKSGVKEGDFGRKLYDVERLSKDVEELRKELRGIEKSITKVESNAEHLREFRREMLVVVEKIQHRMLSDG